MPLLAASRGFLLLPDRLLGVRGCEVLLTRAINAQTDGNSWVHLADASHLSGDLFYNNGRHPMIDYANSGDPMA